MRFLAGLILALSMGVRTNVYLLSLSAFLSSAGLFAQSDYQILQKQQSQNILSDDGDAGSYNVKDVDSFKAKALEHTNNKSTEIHPSVPQNSAKQNQQNSEVTEKIKKALNSFGARIDPNLKAELEKVLSTELLDNREAKKPEHIQMLVPENNIELREFQTGPGIQPSAPQQHTSAISQPTPIKKIAPSAIAQKSSQERIVEINKALANPKLAWGDFEKLLDERKALEQGLKSTTAAVNSKDQKN